MATAKSNSSTSVAACNQAAHSLQSHFENQVRRLPNKLTKLVIGFSGGLDSTVLLNLCHQNAIALQAFSIKVVHVDHGQSEKAARWGEFCRELCQSYGFEFVLAKVQVNNMARHSLEALLRDARYQQLALHVDQHTALLTGHHCDDQLETFVLNLKRGSGVLGLASMPELRVFSEGVLFRPLLEINRSQLEAYAQTQNLAWVEDESNTDQAFDRNYIRHTLSPLLLARWPGFQKSLTRSTQLLQESQGLLDELAQQDLLELTKRGKRQDALEIKPLLQLSVARRNNVLRYWLHRKGLSPSHALLAQLWKQIAAKADAKLSLDIGNHALKRYNEHLYLYQLDSFEPQNLDLEPADFAQSSEIVFGKQCLSWKDGGHLRKPSSDLKVQIKFRADFENPSMRIAGRAGSRSLKKLLQEFGVAPWLRAQLPLLCYDNEIVAIADLAVCEGWYIKQPTGLALYLNVCDHTYVDPPR
ncbi:tRNA lysidine(34) synthetase TilS [Alginatibacterium sediminis]|uniref:tRNA(Ile)-lysidine synthase n=1 Tax=Alginatibacterium sediminis TaxID=2164068 RepID=A0A420E822_9ALTE|nr:tRNA lysidine(34) synthetase TilS [Alginatibacterium sediminis]RKF15497.1 tRNA lysidine(34) synthetase TilS [Alginatibacterium sediminis]